MDDFPSLKARKLLAVLKRRPLGYAVTRQKGSHRRMESSTGYQPLTFSWHDSVTIPPSLVEKTLVDDVGLSRAEALELL
jgi:predicted RNA binding protein YcfA (HicA-like mRNA interferase family)